MVADACQSALHHETDKLEKQKVAGAAADLVGAASEYGHLDQEKGLGKYVEKAEDYLRKYEAGEKKPPEGEGGSKSTGEAGGYGQYMKMAEGFLGGKSGDGEEKKAEGGGSADYMKLAQGLFKS
ncbi:hypothetical protein ACM91E_28730 [Escherichia coli]|uniref:hypothetical protein n=1 Tax=Escherichia coli TaxID=562 RepID=UPI003B9B696F